MIISYNEYQTIFELLSPYWNSCMYMCRLTCIFSCARVFSNTSTLYMFMAVVIHILILLLFCTHTPMVHIDYYCIILWLSYTSLFCSTSCIIYLFFVLARTYEIMSAVVCACGKIRIERNITLQAYNKSLDVHRLS